MNDDHSGSCARGPEVADDVCLGDDVSSTVDFAWAAYRAFSRHF